eukprot:3136675-Amphidinium_carterae.1
MICELELGVLREVHTFAQTLSLLHDASHRTTSTRATPEYMGVVLHTDTTARLPFSDSCLGFGDQSKLPDTSTDDTQHETLHHTVQPMQLIDASSNSAKSTVYRASRDNLSEAMTHKLQL